MLEPHIPTFGDLARDAHADYHWARHHAKAHQPCALLCAWIARAHAAEQRLMNTEDTMEYDLGGEA